MGDHVCTFMHAEVMIRQLRSTAMAKLTARQQQVMDVIKGSIDATGMPPTRADIART